MLQPLLLHWMKFREKNTEWNQRNYLTDALEESLKGVKVLEIRHNWNLSPATTIKEGKVELTHYLPTAWKFITRAMRCI